MSKTRTFSVEQLNGWGLDEAPSYAFYIDVLKCDVWDTDDHYNYYEVVFRPPNEEQAYKVVVTWDESGNYNDDVWSSARNKDGEVEAVLVYPKSVTVTEWVTEDE